MRNRSEPDSNSSPIILKDIQPPENVNVPVVVGELPNLTPAQRVSLYSPNEWEDFVYEWVTELRYHYEQVKSLGGPGDGGIDIAAFNTVEGFEAGWDCYQAKHYEKQLTPSDAFPEMMKIFRFGLRKHGTLPNIYYFVAPKGCGGKLNRLISTPSEFKEWFLGEIDSRAAGYNGYSQEEIDNIRELAEATEFTIFRSLELADMVRAHSETRYHFARFGGQLPARAIVENTPDLPTIHETRYIEKLVDIYAELDPESCTDVASVTLHNRYGPHLQRQRESFYAAESLRLYARDAVPEGTYEYLLEDIYFGVIDTAEADYETGMERLRAVLAQSGRLDLGSHSLIRRSNNRDRQGCCQQLANADRLTWVSHDG